MEMEMLLFDPNAERWPQSLPSAYVKAAETRELWFYFLYLGKGFFNNIQI